MTERVHVKERQNVHPWVREWYTDDAILCWETMLPHVSEATSDPANRAARIAHCVSELMGQENDRHFDREIARELVSSEDEWRTALRQSGVAEMEPTTVMWWREKQASREEWREAGGYRV